MACSKYTGPQIYDLTTHTQSNLLKSKHALKINKPVNREPIIIIIIITASYTRTQVQNLDQLHKCNLAIFSRLSYS